MTQCVDIKTRGGGGEESAEESEGNFSVFICFQNMCLAIYLFSVIKIQYPQAIIITTTIRGGGQGDGGNVALGPCLRLRFACVLTQLDSTWLGLAWPGWDGCCCCFCCCCPSLESSNEFSARLHLKRRALKLPLVSSSPYPPSEFLKV